MDTNTDNSDQHLLNAGPVNSVQNQFSKTVGIDYFRPDSKPERSPWRSYLSDIQMVIHS